MHAGVMRLRANTGSEQGEANFECPSHLHAVVELYADWAGPCKAVRETFKKLYYEHGDGGSGLPLKFFTVSCQCPNLQSHMDSSTPA